MKYFIYSVIFIISFFSCNRVEDKKIENNTDTISPKEKEIGERKIIESELIKNKDNIFFLSFWDGMSINQFESILRLEQDKGVINEWPLFKGSFLYTFKFEDKPNFEDEKDFLEYTFRLSPSFDRNRLTSLGLVLYDENDPIYNEPVDYDPIKVEENFKLLEKQIKEGYFKDNINKKNSRKFEAKKSNYISDQILKIYEEKYGKPEIKDSEKDKLGRKYKINIWQKADKIIEIKYTFNEEFPTFKSINHIYYFNFKSFKFKNDLKLKLKDSTLNAPKNAI